MGQSTETAHEALDAEFQRFLKAAPDESRRKYLTHAQASWRSGALQTCNLYLCFFEGSMWHPVSDQCKLAKIEERTAELRRMREDYER
jgi:uncharacterized protein YecT (DUF1311 family)